MPYIKVLFVETFVYNDYELLCKAKSLVEESFEQQSPHLLLQLAIQVTIIFFLLNELYEEGPSFTVINAKEKLYKHFVSI